MSLGNDLTPHEEKVQWDKIDYIVSRGKLIQKDTIPEHLNYLRRINGPPDAIKQVEKRDA